LHDSWESSDFPGRWNELGGWQIVSELLSDAVHHHQILLSSKFVSKADLSLPDGIPCPLFEGRLPKLPKPYENTYKIYKKESLLGERKEGRKEENIKIIIGEAYYCPGLGRESPVRTGGEKLLLELPDVALVEVAALYRSCRERAVPRIRHRWRYG